MSFGYEKTICIDFDGTITNYQGYKGSPDIIEDELNPGVIESINELKKDYKIIIFSVRATTSIGKVAIMKYLVKHNVYFDKVTHEKLGADLYIDDRGIQYKGDWRQTMKDIKNFKHWLNHSDPYGFNKDNLK